MSGELEATKRKLEELKKKMAILEMKSGNDECEESEVSLADVAEDEGEEIAEKEEGKDGGMTDEEIAAYLKPKKEAPRKEGVLTVSAHAHKKAKGDRPALSEKLLAKTDKAMKFGKRR